METSHMKCLGMNTTKLKIQIAILALLFLALLPTIATHHGGERRVIDTVTSVAQNSITAKTTARTAVTDVAKEDGQ
jgi:hypothetical protein